LKKYRINYTSPNILRAKFFPLPFSLFSKKHNIDNLSKINHYVLNYQLKAIVNLKKEKKLKRYKECRPKTKRTTEPSHIP